VKAINKVSELGKKKEEAPAAPTTKKCPFCKSEISIEAVKCPHCTSEIPEEAANIHGITTERALKEGLPLRDVLRYFCCALKLCDAVVCHNTGFDLNVVGSEFLRLATINHLDGVKAIDTMRPLSEYVGLPNKWGTGYKWPSLQELHNKLFDCGFEDAHDANVDIEATARCFWELKKRGLILD
jgi:DNA polymerase III epsilon subunit-like protein